MLKMLEDTASHYHLENRSLDREGRCVYIPFEGSCSEGCAIGRYMTGEDKKKIVRPSINTKNVGYLKENGLKLSKLKGISIVFLSNLQSLHDMAENWDQDGISGAGKKELEEIKRKLERGVYDGGNIIGG